jgi:large subunit ribosomal protein L25
VAALTEVASAANGERRGDSMETTLAANLRSGSGKGTARKLRSEGKLPAVMYGPGHDATSLTVDPVALTTLFRKTGDRNTIVTLQVEGKDVPVLVREVQKHPVTRELVHVDFFQVTSERKVEVTIPVSTVGRAKGALLGGRIRLIRRSMRALCNYDNIPKTIEVDVTPLDIGDMVKASELVVDDTVELLFGQDFYVLTLYGNRQ